MEQHNMPPFMPFQAGGDWNNSGGVSFDILDNLILRSSSFVQSSRCRNDSEGPSPYTQLSSMPVRQIYKIVLDIFLVSPVCLLGFLGNALTIVILWSDLDKKSTTNWLLQSLAVIDIIYLIACLFIQPLKTATYFTNWLNPAMRHGLIHMEPYIWPLASIAQMVTVWTVMLVTIDRYIAICFPLKSKVRTLERARLAFVVVIAVAIVYNIPLILEREVTTEMVHYDSCNHHTAVSTRFTKLRDSFWYFLIYKTLCYFVFRTIGPLLILITLNIKLMLALREMRRRHHYMTSNSRHRQRENVTLTLVVVVSVFIVCELPDVSLRIAVTIAERVPAFELDQDTIIYLINPMTNMLLTVNSSVNFLIYCLIGKKFRRILSKICLRRCGNTDDRIRPTAQSQTGNSYAMNVFLGFNRTEESNVVSTEDKF